MVEPHEFPYPHPYYEERTGKVICQVCGKPFLTISPRHLKKHDMTYDEYKMKFPDAPYSSEEFSVRSVYGKNKDMFKEAVQEEEEIKIEELEDEITDNEEEVDPLIEELEIIKKQEASVKLDKIQGTKKNILNHLSIMFSNVQQDYFIEEKTISGQLKYKYITDFADPILKVAFFFPKTFWHNDDGYYDELRDSNIQKDGWKIVRVGKMNPTLKDIDDAIQEVF